MVVPVGYLSRTTRFHNVRLRGYAVPRTEPGLADEGQPGVVVVLDEGLGVFETELGEGVPDAVADGAKLDPLDYHWAFRLTSCHQLRSGRSFVPLFHAR